MEHRCYGCMQLHDGDFCPHCGWPVEKNNEVHQLSVGTLLHGQYEIGRVLGQGGFGITYLGWDRQLGAAVCIKEYFPSHAVSRDCTVSAQVRCHTEAGVESFRLSKERFLREGRVLAQFRDIPEIVSVYGSFEENDTVYIVMEYIKGMDLAHYVNHRGGRLSADETFKILKPVMEALAQVHRSELVHRDIAPDNIMLHPRGGAKLLDFGAARMVENADVDKGLDRSTEAIVKHGFAPMEQYQTRGNLGPWTDVYAMCASIYYCLTGQIPPEATTRLMGETSFSWANVPGLTDRQRTALERGMAVLPKDRYRSMEELLDGLFGNAPIAMTYTEPVHAAPQPPVYAPQPPVYAPQAPAYASQPAYAPQEPAPKKRSKLVPILTGVLVAVALLVGGTLLALWVRESGVLTAHEVPAIEAPMTEAPIAEAPIAEAPIAEAPVMEEFYVGMIVQNGIMEDLPEQLFRQLAEIGSYPTVETMYAGSMDEIAAYAESCAAAGCNVVILQTAAEEEDIELLGKILGMLSECGIPTILLGCDPIYTTGDNSWLDQYPGVCYVGADPRFLADELAWRMADTDPDANGDARISYVPLTGAAGWEGAAVDWYIRSSMEEHGYWCAPLVEEIYMDDPEEAVELLERLYFDSAEQPEVIFCADADMVAGAVMFMEMAGLTSEDITIVGLGDTQEMADFYAYGYLPCYAGYSREALVDKVAEVLLMAARGERLDFAYSVGTDLYGSH